MAVVRVTKGVGVDEYEKVSLALLENHDFETAGVVSHTAFMEDGKVTIVDKFETVEAANEWGAKVGATAASIGVETSGGLTATYDPARIEYTVKPFDFDQEEGALSFIANRFHTTVEELAALNNISDPDHIEAGDKLRLFA